MSGERIADLSCGRCGSRERAETCSPVKILTAPGQPPLIRFNKSIKCLFCFDEIAHDMAECSGMRALQSAFAKNARQQHRNNKL